MDTDLINFFHWRNQHLLDFEKAIEIELVAKASYPYFSKFRDISEYVGLTWEHVDLFFFRETKQADFKDRILNGSKLNEFAQNQLALSSSVIEEIDPKIIAVVNACASELFVDRFSAAFDENLGHHTIMLNGRTIPVFLGSMLTGQRAMDRYSYQRLRWQIKKAVDYA